MRKTLLFLAVCSLSAHAQLLEFDPSQTKVEFTLGDVLHTVHGTFQLKHGAIRIDSTTGAVSGEIVVDAASGASGSGARDRRMNSEILESSRFPEITFRPVRLEGAIPQQGQAVLQLQGLFSIHGVEHEVALPVDVDVRDGHYDTTLHFVVPYVKWGMKNPSTFILRVNDKVNITVHTIAHSPGVTQ